MDRKPSFGLILGARLFHSERYKLLFSLAEKRGHMLLIM